MSRKVTPAHGPQQSDELQLSLLIEPNQSCYIHVLVNNTCVNAQSLKDKIYEYVSNL